MERHPDERREEKGRGEWRGWEGRDILEDQRHTQQEEQSPHWRRGSGSAKPERRPKAGISGRKTEGRTGTEGPEWAVETFGLDPTNDP